MRPVQTLHDLQAFDDAVVSFTHSLTPDDARATLVTLSGELGAGKTTFTQILARTLGVEETVTSPTFVLSKSYALPEHSAFSRLVHIDAYRLTEDSGLSALRFSEIMQEPKTLIVLEWPEMVATELPPATVSIRIETLPDQSRTLVYG